jgi:hypothetical protein
MKGFLLPLLHELFHHGAIVESQSQCTDLLVCFMSFSSHQDYVPAARCTQGGGNGLPSIR